MTRYVLILAIKIYSGLLIFLALTQAVSATTCSQRAVSDAVGRVRSIQSQLTRFKFEKDQLPYEIPPEMQVLLANYKTALAETVSAYVACQDPHAADVARLETEISKLLEPENRNPVPETNSAPPAEEDEFLYKSNLLVKVDRPRRFPRVLAIDLSNDIGCGDDHSLLIYEQEGQHFIERVRWQSGPAKDVSEFFGDFFLFAFAPREPGGQWVVAVAHGHPWCTSRWSGFDIDVIEPARGTAAQHNLFHLKEGFVREATPVMKPTRDGFDLRVDIGALDAEYLTRPGIFRYRISDKIVERVQPVAKNGRDFVDEWLRVHWNEASLWSDPRQQASLKAEHESLVRNTVGEQRVFGLITYGAVKACGDRTARFQVEVSAESKGTIFFQIEQKPNAFLMLSASKVANPQCKGADLVKRL